MDATPTAILGTGKISLDLERLDLAPGQYYINAGIYSENWDLTYDFLWRKSSIKVYSNNHLDNKTSGFFCPPATWTISQSAKALANEPDLP